MLRRMIEEPVMNSKNKRIELDWNKLMGFNQVKSTQGEGFKKITTAAIGVKLGIKAGVKPPPAQV
jgi:hypothetical protein